MVTSGMQLKLRYRWLKVLKGNPTAEQLERFENELKKLMELKEKSKLSRAS